MSKVLIAAMALALAGCQTVGWGKAFEEVHKNSKSITFKYDTSSTSIKELAPKAEAHCAQYGKEATPGRIIETDMETMMGAVHTIVFNCE